MAFVRNIFSTEMEMSDKTRIPLLLIICIHFVSGWSLPRPENLTVHISDGEVMTRWIKPADAPSNSMYNIEMAKLISTEWEAIDSCTKITHEFCDLSNLIDDYTTVYKVRVQLVTEDDVSAWKSEKIRLYESDLQPPTFTLFATSSTLSVHVHKKPILIKLFPYGVTYTIYLEDRTNNKTTIAYLNDGVEDQESKTFSSLMWGREYCISMMAEGNGHLTKSLVSSKECLLLPEQEWFIIAVSSLSFLGVLAIIIISASILLCYLRRPEKTPAVLKSPASYWLPLAVEEGTIEVVTDKGWFLYSTELKNCVKHPMRQIMVTEDNEEEERRTSMDSGISVKTNSTTDNEESSLRRQEDSGCGSLGGSENSTSSETDYPLQDERTDTDNLQKREDSGVGLGSQLDSSSIILEGQDISFLKEVVSGGNYRTQSPSTVQSHVCDDEDNFKQILPDTVLAEVVTGYRAGPQLCICSGAGQCTWCHQQGHCGSEAIRQYRTMCIVNEHLNNNCNFVDSYRGGIPIYSKKLQMDTVIMDDFKQPFTQLGETFPLLTAHCPSLSFVEEGHDFSMNNVSLSLCDVELKTD